MTNKRVLATVVCGLLLIATACGSKQQQLNDGTPQAKKSIPTPTFDNTTTMNAIQQRGKFNVGTSFNQPGFSFKDAKGNMSGFDVELAGSLAQGIFGGTKAEAMKKINWVQAESNTRETFLEDGSIDIALGAYQITPAREAVIDFAGPYYTAQADLMVKSTDTRTQQAADVNGKTVCVAQGSSYTDDLRIAAPYANIKEQSAFSQCITDFNKGDVDAVAAYSWILASVVKASNGQSRLVNAPFASDLYGIGVKQGNTTFQEFLNSRLQELENDGDWALIYENTLGKLGLPASPPPGIAPVATTTTSSSTTSSTVKTTSTLSGQPSPTTPKSTTTTTSKPTPSSLS